MTRSMSAVLLSVLVLLSALASPARAAADPEQTLATLDAALEQFAADAVPTGEDEQTIRDGFESLENPTAKRYRSLASRYKRAVTSAFSQHSKQVSLTYSAAVRELKAGKATKTQLRRAAEMYALAKGRVADAKKAANLMVGRVLAEYLAGL